MGQNKLEGVLAKIFQTSLMLTWKGNGLPYRRAPKGTPLGLALALFTNIRQTCQENTLAYFGKIFLNLATGQS